MVYIITKGDTVDFKIENKENATPFPVHVNNFMKVFVKQIFSIKLHY